MHNEDKIFSVAGGRLVDLWEYRLVVQPGGKAVEDLQEEWQWWQKKDPQLIHFQRTPEICLARFMAKEMMEETLMRWIQKICQLQGSFTVQLNNYSGLPPHTIYWRVQDPMPLLQVVNQLRMIDSFIQNNDCPPAELARTPLLPLTDSLPPSVYEDAVRICAERSFYTSFEVQTLVLMKRSTLHEAFRHVNTFTLPPTLS